MKILKKKKENNVKKDKPRYDKGRIFVKVMAASLTIMMLVAAFASLIYAIIGLV